MKKYGKIERSVALDKLEEVIEGHQLHVESAYWYGKGLCFFLRTANKNGAHFIKIHAEDLCRTGTSKDIWQLDINEPSMKIVSVRKMPAGVKQRLW